MPLARIVTSAPAEVAFLCQYLRSLGYTVELFDPLASDSESIESTNSGRRVIAYDITGRPVEFAEEESVATAGSSAVTTSWQRLRLVRSRFAEKLRLSSGDVRGLLATGKRSLDEYRIRCQRAWAQASTRAEESRRDRLAQSQAFEAERSRRQLERARRKAQLEFERERLQREIRQAQQHAKLAEAAFAREAATVAPPPRRHRRDDDLRMAAVGAAILALLAVLGLGAYRSRLLTPVVSNRDLVHLQTIAKPVSFNTTTAALQTSATQQTENSHTNPRAAKVSVPRKIEVVAKPAATEAVVRPHPVRRASTDDGEIIAEDEVIHYRRQASVTTQARSRPRTGPKRISDLE